MPAFTNPRAFLIKISNGQNLVPILGIQANRIIPFNSDFELGADFSHLNAVYLKQLLLESGNIYSQDGAIIIDVNWSNILKIFGDRIEVIKMLTPNNNEFIDLGQAAKRFRTLYAKNGNFSGIVKGIDPVDDEDLATKKYVDENTSGNTGGEIKRTTVQMDIVVPAGLPIDTDLGFYDIDNFIASQLTGDLLNTTEDNRLRLVQNCGLFQAQAKIVNIHLLAVYKDHGNSQYIDFNGYAKQDDTNTFKRILQYSGRSTENNILHSHSVFDTAFTSDVLGQGSEIYLVVQRKFNNTNEIKARVHISIDYQL